MLTIEIAIVLCLIVINAMLALSEMAIVSSRSNRLSLMVDRRVSGARQALALASDPGKFLSAVQIGITLVGVLSGAFSGATIGLRLGLWLQGLGLDDDLAETLGVGAVVLAITYASLVAGELVPKQIALHNPEAVAARIAPAMVVLARITSPLVWLLDASGRLVLRLMGQSGARPDTVTEEEIRTLAAEAENSGVLEPGEKDMIAGVLRLGDRNVQVVMTPRTDVDLIDVSESLDTVLACLERSPHARLPAVAGDDEVLGVISAKDLLLSYRVQGAHLDVRRCIQPAPIIPDSADARDVLATLKATSIHMGLVHDEYGHFLGVVTPADILEAIVGAFTTEEGPAEPDAVRRADGSYLLSGRMPIDEFYELTGIAPSGPGRFHTLAGFVLDGFARLPAVGEVLETVGWRFEVVDMDGHRIDKVLASKG